MFHSKGINTELLPTLYHLAGSTPLGMTFQFISMVFAEVKVQACPGDRRSFTPNSSNHIFMELCSSCKTLSEHHLVIYVFCCTGVYVPLYRFLGTWQVCPQPLGQHFLWAGHSASSSQLSTQAAANPLARSGAGQSPCFTASTLRKNSQLVRHS